MKNMPTVWFSLKRSLHCKSEPSEVHDPKSRRQLSTILTRKPGRSGCSRSISNLRDVINGSSKRHVERPPSCSPRSIGSSDFLNPITHEVVLGAANNNCELKITDNAGPTAGPAYVGTLRPGTPGPGGQQGMHYFNNPSFRAARKPATSDGPSSRRISLDADLINGSSPTVTCHKCGDQFAKWEAAESHHLSKHAVTELVEGDSSRKIVEIICRTSWPKSEKQWGRIERVLKVHNMQKTLGRFEEHRETVKARASKLPKKHPRCIADGNELLRFHGTTLSCQLGLSGSSSLCSSERCSVCRIIRHGFSSKKELRDGVGVFTTSTSGSAFESIQAVDCGDDDVAGTGTRKALIVCRVIAGRVHRPLENVQEIAGQTGFDSLAGKVGLYSNIEELYLLNPRALLPCFVVICKP